MLRHFEAIYEDGVLKPLQPLNLAEHERVSLVMGQDADADLEDEASDVLPFVAEDGVENLTWADAQAITARFPGSLAEDCIRERDERI